MCLNFEYLLLNHLLMQHVFNTLTKRMETATTPRHQQHQDTNNTKNATTILKKYWRQHPTKQQLYGHLLPITKTIRDVIVIVVGNGHGDSSSNPGRD